MSVSLSFSIIIYRLLQDEIRRIALVQQEKIAHIYDRKFVPIATNSPVVSIPLTFDQEIIDGSNQRLMSILLLVNGTIFIVSGGLGYLLAGETLKPIQEMVEDQNRFISDASHELRTPLTALKSTMEVNIRDKNLSIGEARTLIKESIEEVDKLHTLSENLLQLARSKNTQTPLLFKKAKIDTLVHQAVQKVKPLANKKKIKIENKVLPAQVDGQAEALVQVFVIVLDNAIKYSSNNSRITLESQKKAQSIDISIADTGVGIARKDISHIFDRFYRTDSARSKVSAGGYGLGLSIAQQIIISHRGKITVRSQVKNGTTVTISLPLHHST